MSNYTFNLPSLNDFVEFIYFEGGLLGHEINQINSYWDQEMSERSALEGGETYKDDLRKSSVIGIKYEDRFRWIYERMTNMAMSANQQRYGFDILGFYEPLQLAEYGDGDFFDWHLDFGIGASSNRKLSLTVQLSDPADYEGGDLEFRINNKVVKAPREQGSVILFPSFIMHRVTPITKGRRRSIVGWVSGVPFR